MSVTAAEGFVAAGLHAGIKRAKPDMALLATEDRQPVTCAAVFTQNKFKAPPVQLDQALLDANGGKAAAVIVNSGNANAGTGAAGYRDAQAMQMAAAQALGTSSAHVLVCSTGIIGTPLPMDVILPAVPKLAGALSVAGGTQAAAGILTTDHVAKEVVVRGENWTIGGMAKGCGMIAPNMATMLAFLTTDADVPRETLQAMLKAASDTSFNTLNVDGATSTNDTAMIFAGGRKGAPADLDAFARGLAEACRDLTMKMAHDAEGMTRLAHLHVTGAASDAEARIAAKAIAENNLVKCSWYGADPYWGRLLAAAGSAGVALEVERSAVLYGGIKVAEGGVQVPHDAQALTEHMLGTEFAIEVHLGAGTGEARMIGVDLGPGYIKENSVTS
ncbi:bifunctional glutamate N-acetyltransferase/amino-acid acetyltransferase ArgJ [Sphingomonas astaxanthinifaciens]|uniref:Arginine biosynthesis bifunctional protein ArgJ n=1 Tax=Sphingomonas astaxanthinifaciens DSM 22298 TaxID=1123267 RepID=A0ABQ5Z5Y7_9SPHN|nr:bifunctional glutamate N-acetyltransferase/amino-acid acetyltransferase ArgJ [Sphingomonas astaxanthinifaciens]GLR46946.1 arginine biosynthesis bifunctional protein ArgJ [Sphingomonas astaxanthinifaciens DSM 22298]